MRPPEAEHRDAGAVPRAPLAAHAPATTARVRVRVHGTVQGVGFRPHVHRLATELALSGFVRNDSRGVVLEVEGSGAALAAFLARLAADAPPIAVVERIETEPLEPAAATGFAILESARGEHGDAPVAPDTATCASCLAELFDPADRRFRYPFINCTDCGPRFTIVRGVPYDRPLTTMAAFAMCERCAAEYADPADRRFHAQPNACPDCGPRAWLTDAAGSPARPHGACDAVAAAAAALRHGLIVAVKGIGGFHLACRADDERAVATLRSRKRREERPFALMAGSLEQAATLVTLGPAERALLTAPQRPIVLAPRRAHAAVAAAVAPGLRELGVMLPYSPLHHLLLDDAGAPLVMTSGNVADEPIASRDEDARERLAPLADAFLLHDRPIHTRADDSIARAVTIGRHRRAMLIRRSRGHVPASLPLPDATPVALLACGAEQKNAFCVAKQTRAWVSHHIGDLTDYETLRSFTAGIAAFERLFDVEPRVVVHDLHPEYLSTKLAFAREGVELLGVQHHHAHFAACLAEHGERGRAVGAIFDGSGHGADGTVWGGELLCGDIAATARVGSLAAVALPGGAQAIRQPWRMACAWLDAGGVEAMPAAIADSVSERAWRQVRELIRSGVNSPATTSVGRLFDAAAALCGLRATVTYEGQAAVELEAACDPAERGRYPIELRADAQAQALVLDPRETLRALSADVAQGTALGVAAARFHAALAHGTVEACARAAEDAATELVVLSGGVFQNVRLLEAVAGGLAGRGLRVLAPERLPANDGGIAYGQAAVATLALAGAG